VTGFAKDTIPSGNENQIYLYGNHNENPYGIIIHGEMCLQYQKLLNALLSKENEVRVAVCSLIWYDGRINLQRGKVNVRH